MPATLATSERSFSSLRHVKTYVPSHHYETGRLNNLTMLYIHKDRKVDIAEAICEFISQNSERVIVFGKLYNYFIDIID